MSLRKWTSEKWVDIANKRSDGSYPPCGRSKGAAILAIFICFLLYFLFLPLGII